MKRLELTLDDAAANIALDEALLESAEQGSGPQEILRIWEAPRRLVVVGRSSKLDVEVDRSVCHSEDVPVIRRCSGGATVVAGPGCLMYAVVLSCSLRPQLRHIDQAHQFVLHSLARQLVPLEPKLTIEGTSDLAVEGRKVSGNSLRCKRDHLLYHGTLLYDFPLAAIGRLLRTPPRQPEYRDGRSHDQFVANLQLGVKQLRTAIQDAFDAHESTSVWPQELTERLRGERYGQAEWNERL